MYDEDQEESKDNSTIDDEDIKVDIANTSEEEEGEVTKVKVGVSMNFEQYLGGSAIGFSLGTLIMLLVAWILQWVGVELTDPVILAINIVPTMIGSAVATFLYTGKSRREYLRTGIIIGFGAFFITFLYTSLLGLGVGGAYILVGFEIGGILGGLISKWLYETNLQ
jgi:hypothetical protein